MMDTELSKKNKYLSFILISTGFIFLGCFLRIFHISYDSLWFDELWIARLEYFPSFSELKKAIFVHDVNPPGFHFLYYYLSPFLPDNEVGVRFLTLIFGLMSLLLPICYHRQFSNRFLIALLSIISTSFVAIYFSQEARPYSLLMFLSLLTIFEFKNLSQWINDKSHKKPWLYVLSLIAMSWLHYFGALMVFTQGVSLLYTTVRSFKGFARWSLVFLTPAILLLPWIFFVTSKLGLLHIMDLPPIIEMTAYFKFLFADSAITSLLAFILLVLGFRKADKIEKSWLLFSVLGLYLTAYFISYFFTPIMTNRYFTVVVPILWYFLAKALSEFKIKNSTFLILCCLFSTLQLADILFYHQYYSKPQKEQNRHVAIKAHELQELNNCLIVSNEYFKDIAQYYFKSLNLKQIDFFTTWQTDMTKLKNEVAQNSKTCIILIEKGPTSADFNSYLQSQFKLAEKIPFLRVDLSLWLKNE